MLLKQVLKWHECEDNNWQLNAAGKIWYSSTKPYDHGLPNVLTLPIPRTHWTQHKATGFHLYGLCRKMRFAWYNATPFALCRGKHLERRCFQTVLYECALHTGVGLHDFQTCSGIKTEWKVEWCVSSVTSWRATCKGQIEKAKHRLAQWGAGRCRRREGDQPWQGRVYGHQTYYVGSAASLQLEPVQASCGQALTRCILGKDFAACKWYQLGNYIHSILLSCSLSQRFRVVVQNRPHPDVMDTTATCSPPQDGASDRACDITLQEKMQLSCGWSSKYRFSIWDIEETSFI